MATGVYTDGLNLYYGALRGTPYKWLDLEKLARRLLPQDEIAFIRYFSARVSARFGEVDSQVRQSVYLRALQSNPLVHVHLGYVKQKERMLPLSSNKKHPLEMVLVTIDEEKGSDVSLAVHLLNDTFHGAIDKALLVTNDGDFKEAIRLARINGIDVGVVAPWKFPANKHLQAVLSFEIPWRPEILKKCQMEQSVRDAKGREVNRPKAWK
jgi:uncharacterized LabA/DUF88 family protein